MLKKTMVLCCSMQLLVIFVPLRSTVPYLGTILSELFQLIMDNSSIVANTIHTVIEHFQLEASTWCVLKATIAGLLLDNTLDSLWSLGHVKYVNVSQPELSCRFHHA